MHPSIEERNRTFPVSFERTRDIDTVIQGSRDPGRHVEHNQPAGV